VSIFSYVLIDESTTTDPAQGGKLDPGTLELIAWAAQYALDGCGDQKPSKTVCGEYGGRAYVRVGALNDVDPHTDAVRVNVRIRDSFPDEPGAGGWHEDDSGTLVIWISREYSPSFLMGPFSLAEVITHELDENQGDPGTNRYADRGLNATICEAFELSDRLEGTAWKTPNGCEVSNWLLPSAFEPGAPAPYDFVGVLKGQFDTTPGLGWAITRTVGNLLGSAAMQGTIHASQVGRRRHPSSRAFRRGLRLAPPESDPEIVVYDSIPPPPSKPATIPAPPDETSKD
jgi:hypothetical protein